MSITSKHLVKAARAKGDRFTNSNLMANLNGNGNINNVNHQIMSDALDIACKDGEILNQPEIHILGIVLSIVFAVLTFCVIPSHLKIPFVVLIVLLMVLPIVDLVQIVVFDKKQLEQKCKDIVTGKIRYGSLWTLYDIVNVCMGLFIIGATLYYLVRLIFYKDNMCKGKFSLKRK